tara:strand:- start:2091 stop:2906 length:816 start_codon:yes stop_codon:yes gene_type:complete
MSFAPGHISLTFAIHSHADPIKMGSTGLGIVLPQGVYCSIVAENRKGNENIIIAENQIIDDPVVSRSIELLGHGNRGLSVYLRRDLPIGSGFGISGASALAACLELDKNLQNCTLAAHQAEIEYKTGLGDVAAISSALSVGDFPLIVERKAPGANGETATYNLKNKLVVCLSGLGRNTSEIISSPEWSEIINAVSSNLNITDYGLRSVIKVGRIFTEKSGLINENLAEILDSIPIGAVSSVAHLGTSIVASSDNITELAATLEKYGEVRIY